MLTNLDCEEHVQVSVTGRSLSVLLQFGYRLRDIVDRFFCQNLADMSGIFIRVFRCEIDFDEVYCALRHIRQFAGRRNAEHQLRL